MQHNVLRGALMLILLCTQQLQGAASSLSTRLKQIGNLELRENLASRQDVKNLAAATAQIPQNNFRNFYWDGEHIYNKAQDFATEDASHRPTLPPSQSMPVLSLVRLELPRMGSSTVLPVVSAVSAELRRLGEELMVSKNSVIDERSGEFRNNKLITSKEQLKDFAAGYQSNNGDLDQMIWYDDTMMSLASYEYQWRGPVKIRTPYSPPIKLREALRGVDVMLETRVAEPPTRRSSTGIPSPHPAPSLPPVSLPLPTQPTPSPTPPLLPGSALIDISAPITPSPELQSFAPVQEREDIVVYRTNKSQLQDICDSYEIIARLANAIQNEYPDAHGMQNLTEIIVAETAYHLCGTLENQRVMTFDELKNASLERLRNAWDSLFADNAPCAQAMEMQFQNTLGGSKHSEAFSVTTTRQRLPALRTMLNRMS